MLKLRFCRITTPRFQKLAQIITERWPKESKSSWYTEYQNTATGTISSRGHLPDAYYARRKNLEVWGKLDGSVPNVVNHEEGTRSCSKLSEMFCITTLNSLLQHLLKKKNKGSSG